ncbi:MAG: hypothetical protein WBO55_04375 [Rhizobiaceae bacterium]
MPIFIRILKIATLGPSGFLALVAIAAALLAGEALAQEGDIAYGEYLSAECVTCHQLDGSNDGIPAIVGISPDIFIPIMKAYRNKEWGNQVMQTIAGRLDEEMIASLALYFSSIKPAN